MKNVYKGNYTFYNVVGNKEIVFKKFKSNLIIADTFKLITDEKMSTKVFQFKGYGNYDKETVLYSGTITSKQERGSEKMNNVLDMYVFNIQTGKKEYVQMEMNNGIYKAVKGTKSTPSKLDGLEKELSNEAAYVAVERLSAYETMLSKSQRELYGELTKTDLTPSK